MARIWLIIISFFVFIFSEIPFVSNKLNATKEITSESVNKLLAETKKIASEPDLKHGVFSFSLVSLKDNKSLIAYNSDKSVVPASTLKLLTTSAALGILGSDFQFKTQLEYDGTISSGVLNGNIYIKGGGDPSFESELFNKNPETTALQQFVKALQKAGIKKINGNIIGDASIYPENTIPTNWIWEDIGNYYGASPSGLTFKENSYKIYLSSTSTIGDSTKLIKVDPFAKDLRFINRVKGGGKGDNAYIFGAPYSSLRIIEGTIPVSQNEFMIRGSLSDPAFTCAEALKLELINSGVLVIGDVQSSIQLKSNSGKRKLIHTHNSPALEKIIYWTNFKSHNLFAEHLLRAIALKTKGTPDINDGIEAVKKYLSSNGIDLSGMFIADGSGLSRINTVTSDQLTKLLSLVSKQAYSDVFEKSLPTHGSNNIRAKSGYMERARSYSGYITTKNGEKLAFAIIANNYECSATEMRKKMEKIMLLAEGL